jgi:hypothetical protein
MSGKVKSVDWESSFFCYPETLRHLTWHWPCQALAQRLETGVSFSRQTLWPTFTGSHTLEKDFCWGTCQNLAPTLKKETVGKSAVCRTSAAFWLAGMLCEWCCGNEISCQELLGSAGRRPRKGKSYKKVNGTLPLQLCLFKDVAIYKSISFICLYIHLFNMFTKSLVYGRHIAGCLRYCDE